MKIPSILTGAIALVITGSAYGQVTVDITGATAFRAATINTIKARYDVTGDFKFAHDAAAGQVANSNVSIWNGTFNGVQNVTIRCRFNGSVEGISALVGGTNPLYLDNPPGFVSATASASGTEVPLTAGPLIGALSEAAFSDVSIASTPFVTSAGSAAPTDDPVGVVVFTMIANDGAPASLTNITSQGFRALVGAGLQDLSLLTGNSSDAGNFVFATGRNDGSGTRTAYLAETGFGISNPVNQYTVLTTDTPTDQILSIQRVPAGGANDSNPALAGIQPYPGQNVNNRSTVWGQDIDGNGGYVSGSGLATALGFKSANVAVRAADYSVEFTTPLTLVTWISLNDALAPRNNGAKLLAYDGVRLDDIATAGTTMSATDRAKVTNGSYAAWTYQQLFRRKTPALAPAEAAVIQHIDDNIGANLAAAGIPINEMAVGRAGSDGSTIQP